MLLTTFHLNLGSFEMLQVGQPGTDASQMVGCFQKPFFTKDPAGKILLSKTSLRSDNLQILPLEVFVPFQSSDFPITGNWAGTLYEKKILDISIDDA